MRTRNQNECKETQTSGTLSRRSFLRSSAMIAGAATFGAPAILHGASPNERLNIAIIGSGGRGGSNLASVESENIVALCDVYAPNLDAAAAKYPKARLFADFISPLERFRRGGL